VKDSLELIREMGRSGDAVPGTRVTPAPPVDEEECETAAFGYLRGVRDRALNVEFRRAAEGDTVSFPYGWLGPTRYHPSEGIQLLFAGSELYLVSLHGRHLNGAAGLYGHLLRHRVTWCREAGPGESRTLPEAACVVERIEIRAVTADGAVRAFALAGGDEGDGA
jgi:hypothetical protein